MKFNTLLWEVDAGILTLTLNRPDQMNSFTVEMAVSYTHLRAHET